MSILRSLNTGAAGLNAHGRAIGVAGDNIANVNTNGFKGSRAVFQDILGGSVAEGTAPTPGAGSRLSHIEQMWSQGALLTTESPTDLALSGDGFFVVNGTVGGQTGNYYTRAGQFQIDVDGELSSVDGLKVQGYGINDDGTLGSTVGNLLVAGQTIPAQTTTTADLAIQLDSEATVPAAWDPSNAETTSNFSTSMTAYDSLGDAHDLTVYFRNSGANSWEWHALVDGGSVTGGTAGTPFEGANGTLTFTTDGRLDTETPGVSSWNFLGATAGQTIAFDFGDAITTDLGTGIAATTQFATPSSVTGLSQNGFGAGSVAGINVEGDGTITGVFTNGQRRNLGQVAVARFTSNDGLNRNGQGLFVETQASGEALLGAAESGGRGSVVSGALEQSNVDIGQEFVNLISFQRGFQANSRVITTADEMYTELVNLKR
ncbi:MAG: flagellar hook protein FlgE [Myxococcota bacterium]